MPISQCSVWIVACMALVLPCARAADVGIGSGSLEDVISANRPRKGARIFSKDQCAGYDSNYINEIQNKEYKKFEIPQRKRADVLFLQMKNALLYAEEKPNVSTTVYDPVVAHAFFQAVKLFFEEHKDKKRELLDNFCISLLKKHESWMADPCLSSEDLESLACRYYHFAKTSPRIKLLSKKRFEEIKTILQKKGRFIEDVLDQFSFSDECFSEQGDRGFCLSCEQYNASDISSIREKIKNNDFTEPAVTLDIAMASLVNQENDLRKSSEKWISKYLNPWFFHKKKERQDRVIERVEKYQVVPEAVATWDSIDREVVRDKVCSIIKNWKLEERAQRLQMMFGKKKSLAQEVLGFSLEENKEWDDIDWKKVSESFVEKISKKNQKNFFTSKFERFFDFELLDCCLMASVGFPLFYGYFIPYVMSSLGYPVLAKQAGSLFASLTKWMSLPAGLGALSSLTQHKMWSWMEKFFGIRRRDLFSKEEASGFILKKQEVVLDQEKGRNGEVSWNDKLSDKSGASLIRTKKAQ